jgi:hypothetical protein
VAKRLKGWDVYVRDCQRDPVELPLPGDEVITVTMPTGGRTRAFNRAMRAGDETALVTALFGEKDGRRILDLYEDAPGNVLTEVVNDVLREFGMAQDQVGDSAASSS